MTTPKIPEHRQRVIDEASALDSNIQKLNAFLNSDKANAADPQERSFMTGQLSAMQGYSAFLHARMNYWTALDTPPDTSLVNTIPTPATMPAPGDGALLNDNSVPDPNPAATAAGSGSKSQAVAVAAPVGGKASK